MPVDILPAPQPAAVSVTTGITEGRPAALIQRDLAACAAAGSACPAWWPGRRAAS